MQNREISQILEKRWVRLGRAMVLGSVLWGSSGVRGAVPEGAGDDSRPLIVADDEGETAPVQAADSEAGGEAAAAVLPEVVAPGSAAEPEVRRAVVEEESGTVLLDPTRPAAAGNAEDPLMSPLMPVPPDGTASLTNPVPAQRRNPVTGTTRFAPDGKPAAPRDGGPVTMGTELQPAAAEMALNEDGTPLEVLEAPLVESTDPWVFSVEAASIYDDNVRLSARGRQEDFLFVLSASVAWQRGDVERRRQSWARVFYEATGILFMEDTAENSVDHDFQAAGQKRWGRLAVVMENRYRRLSGATPDLGDRVERDEASVKLGAVYDLTGRAFAEVQGSWNAVRYDEAVLADYDEWVAEAYLGYEVTGRTRLAAGGGAGQLRVDGGGTQDFQRALVKVTRGSSGALELTAKAGAEFRQTPRGGSRTTPVFSVSADWEPVEDGTRVSAGVFRETVASGSLAGENYLRTGGALRVSHRLGNRFVAGLETGYEQLEYSAAGREGTGESGRSDDYFFVRPSLKYEFAARRRAEIFYSFREDQSSVEDFSFTANQWGVSIGLDF